ncbi:MAG: glycosyltransferase family 2 protein [Phycisphaerales bacterium]
MPLSVAIVCRNNEPTIGRTLESVAGLADEIVAVDSGSTDGTIGLLERHGARVIASAWLGHVATKQKALEACTREWVLCLDSDESLEPDLRRAVEEVIRRGESGPSGYEVNRVVYYRGRALRHAWQPEYRLRLVRRGRARWTGLDPHDKLELLGSAGRGHQESTGAVEGSWHGGRLLGTLRHDSISTFAEFLAKQAQHARTMAESLHREGTRGSVARLCVSPAGAFLKQIVLKRAFLDGWPGWLAAASSASGALMKHAMLIELSRRADADLSPRHRAD